MDEAVAISETVTMPVSPLPSAPDTEVIAKSVAPPRTLSSRLQEWLRILHRDPSAEERAAQERRERLLVELNRAVAEAPDDLPLRDLIERINHPDRD